MSARRGSAAAVTRVCSEILQQLVEPRTERRFRGELRTDAPDEIGEGLIAGEIAAELHEQCVLDEQLTRTSAVPLAQRPEP